MPRTMTEPRHPLSGVRVLDLTDEYGAYASRLLRDLGAEVLRIDMGDTDPVWPGPTAKDPAGTEVSLASRFVNAGKTIVPASVVDHAGLVDAVRSCDVLLEAEGALDRLEIRSEEVDVINPDMIRITVSPYGSGNNHGDRADDLLVMGAGGLLHLGGYRDLGPMAAWGGQATLAASIFAAVGALVGLLQRESSGAGFAADVSAQESIAQALEDSVAEFSLTGHARDRRGEQPREAGTGTYLCADGHVSMVAGRLGTARAWAALVEWLIEADTPGATDLASERWSDFDYRRTPEAVARFGEVFAEFSSTRSMESLYGEAQARAIALSPMNDVAGIIADRQLAARGFYVEVEDEALGRAVLFPGPPYRLSETPVRRPISAVRGDRSDVTRFSSEESIADA